MRFHIYETVSLSMTGIFCGSLGKHRQKMKDYTHPDDRTLLRYVMTPGFKPLAHLSMKSHGPGRGQLRINFTRIFKVFTKLPESRCDEGNLENIENTGEINPQLHEGTWQLHVYHIKGKIIEGCPFSAAKNNNQHAPIWLKFNSRIVAVNRNSA